MVNWLSIKVVSVVLGRSVVLAIVVLVVEIVEVEAIVLGHVVVLEWGKTSEPIDLRGFRMGFMFLIIPRLGNCNIHRHVIIMLFRNGIGLLPSRVLMLESSI
jgi:hypothetical protein